MDSKRLLVVMVVSLAILIGWKYVFDQMAKRYGWDISGRSQKTEQVAAATQETAAGGAGPEIATVTSRPATIGGMQILGAETAAPASLGSAQWKDSTWAIGVETQAEGAAISKVVLNEFPRSLEQKNEPYAFQQHPQGGRASMATAYARVNGQQLDLSNAMWKLVEQQAGTVVYAIEVGDSKPALRINKRVEVKPRQESGKPTPGAGYEVLVRHTLENLSGGPMEVALGIGGPTMPPREVNTGPDLNVLAGYNDNPSYQGQTKQIKIEAHPVEALTGEKQTIQIAQASKGWPMIWAGMTSTYFDALVLPIGKEDVRTAEYLDKVQVKSVHPERPTEMTAEMLFETKGLSLKDATPVNLDMQVFFGPKSRALLKDGYYGVYPRHYDLSLTTGGSCTWCTVAWLVDVMVNLLRAFHFVLRDWGLAIIALVLVVRALMHPLTRKSTISMYRMSKLAPEMERIKKKYADNPEEQQRAMLAFQKEYAPGMLLGCLPMFIQMPIWVALWSSLQSTFELRLAPFLWGYTWIKDLARPDHLVQFSSTLNLWFIHIDGINILPILLAVVFYLQQKIQPQQPATTPEQQQQQKMMKWMMVLMFPLMLYSGPAGLNLYILTSTTIGILESWWIRQHIKAREAAEVAGGPVIIDAPATRGARRRHGEGDEPAAPKGRFGQWWEKMMAIAEQAQRQAQQQKQKGDRKGR